MALEVTYRERLHRVYREVKNRLDYHISVQNMMRQKEQEHMINWVEKHVVQSISAQQVHDVSKLMLAHSGQGHGTFGPRAGIGLLMGGLDL